MKNWRSWSFPLRVIGANSIAAYVMAHLFDGFIASALNTNLGPAFFQTFGPAQPFVRGALVLLVLWLILLWMYRRKLFLKI